MITLTKVRIESIDLAADSLRWLSLDMGDEFTTKADDMVPHWAQVGGQLERLAAENGLCDLHFQLKRDEEGEGPAPRLLRADTVVNEESQEFLVRIYARPSFHQMMVHFDNYEPINGYALVKPTTYEMRRGSLILAQDEATENRSMRHVFEVLKVADGVTKVQPNQIVVMSKAAIASQLGHQLTPTLDTSFNEYLLLHEDDIAAVVHREAPGLQA